MRATRETISQIVRMARGKRSFTNQTVSTKEFSKMVCSMVLENSTSPLAITMLASSKKDCAMAKELLSLLMVMSMKVIGTGTSRLEMEF